MVKLTRAEHLKMAADKKKKTIPTDYKSVDFYDTDLLEKSADDLILGFGKMKPFDNRREEEKKSEHEFHESYCS